MSKILDFISKYNSKKYWVIGLVVVGALIMFIGGSTYNSSTPPEHSVIDKTKSEYIGELENRLSETISKISGVGETRVMITLKNSKEVVVATEQKETEQSTIDGERKNTNFNKESKLVTLNEQPLVVKEMEPTLEGVIIIAEGAGNSSVKAQVSNAAQVLLGLDAHKVAVFQLKKGGK